MPLLKNIILFCVQLNRAVEKLLAKAGDILNVVKSDGFTTLHIAAINDYREIAKILLKQVNFFIVIHEHMKNNIWQKRVKTRKLRNKLNYFP